MIHGNFLRLDQYQLDLRKKLGSGNCGSVYLGYYSKGYGDEKTLLAIKQIPVTSKYEVTDSLIQQINLMRRLNHPNIVKYIDAKQTSDAMYLIMQFCNEGSLEDLVQTNPNMTEKEVFVYFRQIIKAFQKLHELQIIHRDIKPANILIKDGICQLADFGVAKIIDDNRNNNVTFKGTIPFMAPQILKLQGYSNKSDIWSLGVTLYYLLFKTEPWSESNPIKLLNVITKTIETGSLFKNAKEKISPEVQKLISEMLCIDEQKRIDWEDLFNHPLIVEPEINEVESFTGTEDAITSPRKGTGIKDQTGIIMSTSNASLRGAMVEVTKKSLMEVDMDTNSDTESGEMEENAKRVCFNYLLHQQKVVRGINAKKQLQLEIDKGEFFSLLAKNLEKQKQLKPDIPDDLFLKTTFLLYQRSFVQYLELNHMLTFGVNQHGTIEIQENDWNTFITQDQYQSHLVYCQRIVAKGYLKYKKEYSIAKDNLFEAIQTRENFDVGNPWGDVYQDVYEQNVNMIKAYNDTILQLFRNLAKPLVELYDQKVQQIMNQDKYTIINAQYVMSEQKIDVYLVYDLMVALCFLTAIRQHGQADLKFPQYYEEKKNTKTVELIFRMKKALEAWSQEV